MLTQIIDRILNGGAPATIDEALALADNYSLNELLAAADNVRMACCGNTLDTCSILNARSGHCSEDCKWCSQSRHYATGVNVYDVCSQQQASDAAADCSRRGVKRFSLVTSGRSVKLKDISEFCSIFRTLKAENPQLHLCASMGLLGKEQLQTLKDAGVSRYHCNLETSSDNFPNLCTTHTHADKLHTIAMAREVGMEVCSGGIIGMGESLAQRLMLVKEAYEAGAVSIPVNILNPIPGTPLANTPLLSDDDILLTVALMRLVAPTAAMRFAGGRARLQQSTVERILRGGMNGVMVGDMLTTVGNSVADDYAMFAKVGYQC